MKKLSAYIFSFFCMSASISAQTDYMINKHVDYEVDRKNGQYYITYRFNDQYDELVQIKFSFPSQKTDEDIKKFGIPMSMFDPFPDRPETIKARKRIIESGLFRVDGDIINVDRNRLIETYIDYCKPIALRLAYYLHKEKIDTRRDRIELAMRFVQDIPYGVPEKSKAPDTHFGGVSPIPEVLINGWGDCDSKAFLFIGILAHLIDFKDVLYAGETGHLFTVIRNDDNDIVKNGKTTYFEVNEKFYLVAETAGPARLPFGFAGDRTDISANLVSVKLKHVDIIKF